MKNNELKLLDLEPEKTSIILKTKLNRKSAINLATKITELEDFKYALELLEQIKDEIIAKQFELLAIDGNLQNTNKYKDVLDIAFEQERPVIIERMRNVLCNIGVTNSECYDAIINLISGSDELIIYILDIVEDLVMYSDINLTTDIFRRIMNLNKLLVRRMCIVLSNNYINSQKAFDIISKVILGTKNIDLNEKNLERVIICLENITIIRDNEPIELLLNLIDAQVTTQLNEQNPINISLPTTIEVSDTKSEKVFKLNLQKV